MRLEKVLGKEALETMTDPEVNKHVLNAVQSTSCTQLYIQYLKTKI